jgi:hypothetical protein
MLVLRLIVVSWIQFGDRDVNVDVMRGSLSLKKIAPEKL